MQSDTFFIDMIHIKSIKLIGGQVNTRTYHIILTLLFIFFTSSCSNRYVSTNLDKENFSRYFSPSKVKIYQSENDIQSRYQFIDIVEGQDCQVKAHHAAPDEINARTHARQEAYTLHANAIVFSSCAVLSQAQLAKQNMSNDAKQCHALVICYGKAYSVDANNK